MDNKIEPGSVAHLGIQAADYIHNEFLPGTYSECEGCSRYTAPVTDDTGSTEGGCDIDRVIDCVMIEDVQDAFWTELA